MTREEAIDCNKNLRMYMRLSDKNQPCKFLEENYIALDMAIKALEQEPCGDAISRVKTVKFLANHSNDFEDVKIRRAFQEASSLVNNPHNLPPIQSQPKTGHWIWELKDWNKWICSECGWSKRTDVHVRLGYNFCPSCGSYNGGNKE